jgi:hypothetical protein
MKANLLEDTDVREIQDILERLPADRTTSEKVRLHWAIVDVVSTAIAIHPTRKGRRDR